MSASATRTPLQRLRFRQQDFFFSCGGWTPRVFKTLFRDAPVNIPLTTLAGYSLVVKNSGHEEDDACHSVYCSLDDLSPEVFSRKNGVIYLAGVNSSTIPLPELATGIKTVDASLNELKAIARRLIKYETARR